MTAQLALDLSHDPGSFDQGCPASDAPRLRPVDAREEADGQRLATVHRLFTDVLAAEPAVVADVRRAAAATAPTPGPVIVRRPASPAVHRRRRLVVAVALGLLVSALSLLGGELVGRMTGTPGIPAVGASVEPVVHVVQPGDTLWSIARDVAPVGVDLRTTVDRLVATNGGSVLQVGQRIVLPAG